MIPIDLNQALPDPLVRALPYLILALLPAMFLYAYLRTRMSEYRRRRRMERFAADHGLGFEACPPPIIHERFEVRGKLDRLEPFGVGWHRSSRNAAEGTSGELRWQIFDYHCRVRSGEGRETVENYTIVSASLGVAFPRTTLRPQNILYRLMSLIGFADIRVGDTRFDRRYRIDGEDPEFARVLLQPPMREFIDGAQHRHWQLGPPGILLFLKGYAPAHRIAAAMGEIEAFVARIPRHLLTRGRGSDNGIVE